MKTARDRQRVGIVGIPPLEIIRRLEEEECQVFDLDEPQVKKDIEAASPFLPRVYCAILRTVVINALALQLDRIYIDVGPGKCDSALHTATILADILPGTEVIPTRNLDSYSFGTPLCRTRMPLLDKMLAITASVRSVRPHIALPSCPPTAGFWGVPPTGFFPAGPLPRYHPYLRLDPLHGKQDP